MSFNNKSILKTYGVAKSVLARTAGKVLGPKNQGPFTLRFYKEQGGWFADVPNWPGPKAALAMVWGADTFLDYLSNGVGEVTVSVSDKELDNYAKLQWVYDNQNGDGAHYQTTMNGRHHVLWLCAVTEFVMGKMPREIWFSTVA
jgi:hypothetical protein